MFETDKDMVILSLKRTSDIKNLDTKVPFKTHTSNIFMKQDLSKASWSEEFLKEFKEVSEHVQIGSKTEK